MNRSVPPSPPSHPLRQILASPQTGWRIYRYAILTLFIAAGLYNFALSLKSLSPEFVYRKDIIQEYLMTRAVLAGVDPYLPCPELAKLFIGPLPNNIVLHPNPHPPPMALLCLPLGWLTYPQAAVVWFLLEIFCLLAACYWLVRWFSNSPKRSRLWLTGIFALVLLAWGPFMADLANGQIMIPLLFLLVGSWQAISRGQNFRGGILLGSAVALKLIAWPLGVFLALKRNWAAALSALLVLGLANFFAGMLMGFDKLAKYYLEIGPMVSQFHRSHGGNFSGWSIGARLFSRTGSEILVFIEAPPLVYSPEMAQLFSFLLPSALLVLGMYLAWRRRDFNLAWGMLICVSILISPVAWAHYLTLAVLPAVVVGRYLSAREWPVFETHAALVVGLALFVSVFCLSPELYRILQGLPADLEASNIRVPFWLGLASFSPALALGGLLWLLGRLDRHGASGSFSNG